MSASHNAELGWSTSAQIIITKESLCRFESAQFWIIGSSIRRRTHFPYRAPVILHSDCHYLSIRVWMSSVEPLFRRKQLSKFVKLKLLWTVNRAMREERACGLNERRYPTKYKHCLRRSECTVWRPKNKRQNAAIRGKPTTRKSAGKRSQIQSVWNNNKESFCSCSADCDATSSSKSRSIDTTDDVDWTMWFLYIFPSVLDGNIWFLFVIYNTIIGIWRGHKRSPVFFKFVSDLSSLW